MTQKNALVMIIALVAIVVGGVFLVSSNTGTENTDTEKDKVLKVVRVGYFPNITHAQALVGLSDGTFQTALGETTIEATTFNAGPAEVEALFAGDIDLGYIGPSPALNGYVQSQGEALRIVSGAMSGGAVLVLQPELATAFADEDPSALRGKKIASPQLGNTQDISLRHYLSENGLQNDATVIPIANADQLTLFSQGELDGSWAPEPWASRLVQETGAVVAIDERSLWPQEQFATTVVIARAEFIEEHPEVVQQWVDAHQRVTEWMITHPTEAQAVVNTEIERLTTKGLTPEVLADAWARLEPQTTLLKESITAFAQRAEALGYLDLTGIDITTLYDESFL